MSRKIKPCYTLSDATISYLSIAVWIAARDAWRNLNLFHDSERAEQRDYIRKWIAAYRQIEGYREAKLRQSSHRSVMRSYPKRIRKQLVAMNRRARKHARSPKGAGAPSPPVDSGSLRSL